MTVFGVISVSDRVFKGWLRLMMQRDVEPWGRPSPLQGGRWPSLLQQKATIDDLLAKLTRFYQQASHALASELWWPSLSFPRRCAYVMYSFIMQAQVKLIVCSGFSVEGSTELL